MEGSIYELLQALYALQRQEGGCREIDPVTEERCGEEVSHFYSTIIDTDSWTDDYLGVCQKHHAHHSTVTGPEGHLIDESLDLKDLLEKAAEAGTKEEVIALVTEHEHTVWQRFFSYMEYADQAASLEGPGTVSELNEIFEETIAKARK